MEIESFRQPIGRYAIRWYSIHSQMYENVDSASVRSVDSRHLRQTENYEKKTQKMFNYIFTFDLLFYMHFHKNIM